MSRIRRSRGHRADRRRAERGASPPLVIVLTGLVAGAVAGLVLERTDVVDPLGEPAPAVVRIDRITAHDCPEGAAVASLARGDRVLATARSNDGEWTEIRSPLGLDQRAWVPTEALEPDPLAGAAGDLPRRGCEIVAPTSTSSTTTSSTSSTTTSSTTTSTTTTTTTIPTTTTAPPNQGPLIATFAITGRTSTAPPGSSTSTSSTVPGTSSTVPLGPFQYVHALPESGVPPCPTLATLRVQVADPEGLSSVVVTWDTGLGAGGSRGDVVLQDLPEPGITWGAGFDFPSTALPPEEEFRQPTFTVTARDARGAVSTLTVAPPVPNFRVYGADDLPCDR